VPSLSFTPESSSLGIPAPSLAGPAANPLLMATPSTIPVMGSMTSAGTIPVPNLEGILGTSFKAFGALGVLSFLKHLSESRK